MWRVKNILCLYQPELDNSSLLTQAAMLAINNQAKLTVAITSDEWPLIVNTHEQERQLLTAYKLALHELMIDFADKLDFQTKIISHFDLEHIRAEVEVYEHDLLIKTAQRDSSKSIFSTDLDQQLLRANPCPVWLIKEQAKQGCTNILAAVDVKQESCAGAQQQRHALNLDILRVAASIALAKSSQLHVVAFWHAEHESTLVSSPILNVPEQEVGDYINNIERSYQQNLDSLLAKKTALMGSDIVEHLSPTIRLLKGNPKIDLPVHASDIDADLVVMGTAARTGMQGFIIGNTVEDILPSLQHSVLTIKATSEPVLN